MNKQFDKNGLDEIFDVSDVIDVDFEQDNGNNSSEQLNNNANHSEKENRIENELNETMIIAKSMLNNARIVMDQNPDPEAMSAAADIVNSVTSIIKELSSFLKMERKHQYTKEIENLKKRNRKEIDKYKAELNPFRGAPDNSNIYLQQNNYNTNNKKLQFQQEAIVKKLNEEEKKTKY